MNRSWGFNLTDHDWKSARELIHTLARAAGSDANLLLNVGPRPDGTIQPEAVERLRAIGEWLAINGRSIYGTRGGPIPPRSWGVTTRRGDTVFVHVLDWPDRELSIPGLGAPVESARLLATGEPVAVDVSGGGLVLTLPPGGRDEPDRVIAIELRRQRR
jgi:alpha-L-fucosidase